MARKGKSHSKPHIQEQCGVWMSAKGRSKLQVGSTDQRILPCYGLKPKKARTVLTEMSTTLPNPRIGGKQSTLSMFFKPTPILCKDADADTVKKTAGKHDTHLDIEKLITPRNHSVSEDVTNFARVKQLHQTQGADKENEFHSDEEDFENGNLLLSKEKKTLSSVPKIDSKKLSEANCGTILSDDIGCSSQDGIKQWQNFNANNSFEGKAHIKHEHISHNARGKRKGCFDESPSSKQPRFQDVDGDDEKLSRHPNYSENCSWSENYQTISSQTNSTDDLSVSADLVYSEKNPKSSRTRDLLESNFMQDHSSCLSASGGMTSELNTNIDSVLDFYPKQKREKGNSENVFNSVICTELTEENSFTPSILKDSSLDYSLSPEEPLQSPSIERESDGMINKRESKRNLGLSSKNSHSMLDTPVFDTLDDFTLLM